MSAGIPEAFFHRKSLEIGEIYNFAFYKQIFLCRRTVALMLHRKLLIAEKISCTGRCKLLRPVFLFYRDGLYFDSSEKVKNISLFPENGFSWMVVCIQEFAVSHNVKVVLLCFYRLKKQNFLLTERFLCGKTIV